MKAIIIKQCKDCPNCQHNGLLQTNPKYLCEHKNLYVPMWKDHKHTVLNGQTYWYGKPVICNVDEIEDNTIPKWCPLEDVERKV